MTLTGRPLTLAARMAAVMGGVHRIGKTGWNDHHKYQFATDGDVSDAVRTLLAEHGIAFWIAFNGEVSREKHGNQTRMVIDWIITLENADDPSDKRVIPWRSESLDAQDKGINKAATAAVKYFLLKTFLVSTGEEQTPASDGDTDSQRGEDHVVDREVPETITPQQIAIMQRLVTEGGGTWAQFQETISEQTGGKAFDGMPTSMASRWIEHLEERVRSMVAPTVTEQKPGGDVEPEHDPGTGEVSGNGNGAGEQERFDYGPPPMTDEDEPGAGDEQVPDKPSDTERTRDRLRKGT